MKTVRTTCDLVTGDRAFLCANLRPTQEVIVGKVGRKYLHLRDGPVGPFDRATGRMKSGDACLETREQHFLRQKVSAELTKLAANGIVIFRATPSERALRIAEALSCIDASPKVRTYAALDAALRVLDAGDAALATMLRARMSGLRLVLTDEERAALDART